MTTDQASRDLYEWARDWHHPVDDLNEPVPHLAPDPVLLAQAMVAVLDTTTRRRVLPFVDDIVAAYDRLATATPEPVR